ncbi:MAG: ABC transporter substrate-binding protein [Candidatus Bathyarchaeia archaeon]
MSIKWRLLCLLTIALLALSLTQSDISAEKEEKVLRDARTAALIHWNPFAPGFGYTHSVYWWEPLAIQCANGTWLPWLATKWEFDSKTNELKVNLRKGVVWHDGKMLTSEDVLTTWTCIFVSLYPQTHLYVDKVYAIDEYNVVFRFRKIRIDFDRIVLFQDIYPASVWGRFGNQTVRNWLETNATEKLDIVKSELLAFRPTVEELIGTGPFKVTVFTPEWLILEKHKNYWRVENIKWDKVTVQYVKSGDVVRMMFLAGDIDITYAVTAAFLEEIMKRPERWRVIRGLQPFVCGPTFDMWRYPLSLKEVRQAIAYAINRTEFTVVARYTDVPLGSPPLFMMPQTIYTFLTEDFVNRLNKYEYNPEKAEQILKDLGFTKGPDGVYVTPNGTRLEFDVPYIAEWGWIAQADNIASQLAKIGIKINPVALTWPEYWQSHDLDHKYPIYVGRQAYFGSGHPWYGFNEIFVTMRQTKGANLPWRGGNPYFVEIVDVPTWVDPTAGKVNVTELTIKLGETLDLEEQKRIVKILVWYVNEYVPILPVYIIARSYIANPKVIGGWDKIPDNDPVLYGRGDEGIIPTLMSLGLIWPYEAPVTPPTYIYVTVYAKTNIPAFTGVDGETYGPYKEGDAMLIPKEDAERLVAEGKATYSPPVPAEIPEIARAVSDLLGRVSRLETSVSTIGADVSALSKKVDDLSGQIASIAGTAAATTTTVVGIGAVIIILSVISLIMSLRKK